MPIFTNGPLTESKPSIYDAGLEPSTGEYLGASIEGAFESLPTTMATGRAMAWQQDAYGERLTRQDATREMTRYGVTAEIPDEGISRFELEAMIALHQHEKARQQVFSRNQSYANYALGTGAYLATGAVDPVNVASAMIPVVGEARYAKMLEDAGSYAGRMAVRARIGALAGVAGAALVEPFNFDLQRSWGRDYDPIDSFSNIVLGAPFGAGLHVIGGAAYEAVAGWRPSRLRDYAGVAPDDIKRAAMQAATESLERGVPVDVEHFFGDHLKDRYGVTDDEFVNRAIDFDQPTLDDARSTVVAARGGENETAPQSLVQAIRTMGGIKVRNDLGDLTREGMEVLAALGDSRPPGLVNNRAGLTADYMREALQEDGWFGQREDQGADLQELYDALERSARGERVLREGATRGKRLKDEAATQLTRAGITDDMTLREASMRLAEARTLELRQRMADVQHEPDFEPSELVWREPGEEVDDLAGPVTDETLARYEPEPRPGADESDAPDLRRPQFSSDDPLAEVMRDAEDLQKDLDAEGEITPEEYERLDAHRQAADWAEVKARAFEAAAECMRAVG